ncbi:50S ribosomal protein L33 [Nicoliella lavandulae]|uniref:Large ribosomal subunit protein bL33 n=1 Tax=Nicoliella lavandulae TaxID=3082954 RepID=A0ABU8SJX5_9LACO
MSQNKLVLACSVCGARNYVVKGNASRTERLTVNKFCKHCGKYTLHRETR